MSKTLITVVAAAVLMVAAATARNHYSTYVGTPYTTMNCSQFACLATGHMPSTAKQLFDEGQVLTDMKDGDIICFHGVHVGVWTDQGLMDSTPERGVGLVTKINKLDPWYAGPIRIVRTR